jgi:hypothetical protein
MLRGPLRASERKQQAPTALKKRLAIQLRKIQLRTAVPLDMTSSDLTQGRHTTRALPRTTANNHSICGITHESPNTLNKITIYQAAPPGQQCTLPHTSQQPSAYMHASGPCTTSQ